MQKRLICIEKYVNKIINGNALEVLKEMPSDFVDMVITSPPYWALRNYGTNEQIWDGLSNCRHEWEVKKSKPIKLQSGNPVFQRKWRSEASNEQSSTGCFCIKCGAWKGELGLETTFDLYIKHLADIFDQIKRVLKPSGTCWVNLGDTYGGHRGCLQRPGGDLDYSKKAMGEQAFINGKLPGTKHKCLCMIPERFSIEMIERGWILRNQIIWNKPNCMPSSVTDRFTVDFEKLFFFTKSTKYNFNQQFDPHKWDKVGSYRKGGLSKNGGSVDNPVEGKGNTTGSFRAFGKSGRNKRCVWKISPKPFKEAHFAVYPPELIETPIKAGCPENGIVLDPFMGSGTTALVALRLKRKFTGIELNPKYIQIAEARLKPEIEQLRLF